MLADLVLPPGAVLNFLFILFRISSIFAFVPFPGARNVGNPARVVFCLGTAFALFPHVPQADTSTLDNFGLAGILLMEMALGTAVGLLVGIAAEAFQFGAQMVSLQAGLSFATTIDPNSEAESTVMITLSNVLAGLLFFVFGFDHRLIAAMAASLSSFPPGAMFLEISAGARIASFLSTILSTGFTVMLPVVAFLVLLDVTMAMLGRFHAQLQLLSFSFPLKLLCVTALLSGMMLTLPHVYRQVATDQMTRMDSVLRGTP